MRISGRPCQWRRSPLGASVGRGAMNLIHPLAAFVSLRRSPAAPRQSTSVPRVPLAVLAFLLVWTSAVAYGVLWIWNYKTTPGVASGPPSKWPASSGLRLDGPTLVVTFHPLCTCSQASVSELARLLASVPRRPTVYAVFADVGLRRRDGTASGAIDTSLWERAAAIPGVTTIADPDGGIVKAFGAATSGDVIAYSAAGDLMFHGGLTAARGHEGDSFGRQRLLAVLRGDTPDLRTSPVFGCSLHDTRSDLE